MSTILPTAIEVGDLMPRVYYTSVPKSRNKCVQTSVHAVHWRGA